MKKTKDLISKSVKLLLVFGIIFSQLSFPLSVLADEVSELNEQIEILNQEEANNTNGKSEENQSEVILIEENVPLELEQSDFTVELIEEESKSLYVIKNKLNKTLTVKQLKDSDKEITKVLNKENTEVTEETDIIKNGYQVEKTKEDLTSRIYTIVILADYNDDGMITESDKTALLENLKTTLENDEIVDNISLVDLNKDEKFDILDVTYPIFNEDKWENDKIATDNLENYLMASSENVYLEEEIEVDYYIEGFEIDSLVGIQGKINYDDSLLELTKITVNGEEKNITELVDDKFIYLLNNYNQSDALITLTFKALAIGTPIVSIEDIVASLGGTKAILDNENVSTSFENLEYGKGGNEEENPSTPEPITPPTTETTEPVVVQTTSTPVLLSSNNDIKSLVIEGYEIEFKPNTYEYTIKVKNDVTSLNLSVLLSSSKAIYYIEGNENFKDGENLVYVVVKAENGSTKTYTIRVEKEKAKVLENKETNKELKEETEEEKTSTSKTIIIILIIIVIIGLIYVIFKDDEEETKEKNTKKENTKEVKKTTKKGSKK